MDNEKLLKIKKKHYRGAIGALYDEAKKTGDKILIREMNKIIIKHREKKSN